MIIYFLIFFIVIIIIILLTLIITLSRTQQGISLCEINNQCKTECIKNPTVLFYNDQKWNHYCNTYNIMFDQIHFVNNQLMSTRKNELFIYENEHWRKVKEGKFYLSRNVLISNDKDIIALDSLNDYLCSSTPSKVMITKKNDLIMTLKGTFGKLFMRPHRLIPDVIYYDDHKLKTTLNTIFDFRQDELLIDYKTSDDGMMIYILSNYKSQFRIHQLKDMLNTKTIEDNFVNPKIAMKDDTLYILSPSICL
jgi:hypothetical protein